MSLLLVTAFLICTAFTPMLSNIAIKANRSFLRRCATQRSHQQLRSHPSIAHRYTVSALHNTTPDTACTASTPMLSNIAIRANRSFLRRCATQRSHQQLWSHPSIAHRYTVSALHNTTPGTADSGAASDFTKIEITEMLEDAAR